MGEIEIMLYKDTFLELAAKEGFAMDVIGYDYLEQLHRYIPIFKLPENERDIPTNGGAIYLGYRVYNTRELVIENNTITNSITFS